MDHRPLSCQRWTHPCSFITTADLLNIVKNQSHFSNPIQLDAISTNSETTLVIPVLPFFVCQDANILLTNDSARIPIIIEPIFDPIAQGIENLGVPSSVNSFSQVVFRLPLLREMFCH
jgi:hypothetical protein